ncbi:DUF4230 domain-containing protein [Streptococcus fryi]
MPKSKKSFLKTIFSYKIYAWITALIILLFLSSYLYGYFSGKSKPVDNVSIGSTVKKLEKVQEVTFLNIGIQEVVSDRKVTKVLKQTIAEKKVLMVLNYNLKVGITSPVNIKKMDEKHFQIEIPKYDIIGMSIPNKNSYKLYDKSGTLLSFNTEDIDTAEVADKARSDTKKQKKYIKEYIDIINQSAESYYTSIFNAIDSEIKLDFVFP